jgi:RNA polymerase sigma-70 factor (ECF subfamily)
MLGDVGEAEDVVQEAFARLHRTGIEHVDDAKGWLIVVTSRLCLDQIGSARSRRQTVVDLNAPEHPLPDQTTSIVDPADRVTLDDNVRLALLVVLERLSPAERVVFVLHDIFQMPFETVAETVGRSAPTCRQLARRARLKIEESGRPARFTISESRHREVTERFIAACATGNLEALLETLDPDVTGVVDIVANLVNQGADTVGKNLMRFWGPPATMVSQPMGEGIAILGFIDRKLAGVLMVEFREDRISEIHAIADPVTLAGLQAQLSGAR